jgi:hypothetical protein
MRKKLRRKIRNFKKQFFFKLTKYIPSLNDWYIRVYTDLIIKKKNPSMKATPFEIFKNDNKTIYELFMISRLVTLATGKPLDDKFLESKRLHKGEDEETTLKIIYPEPASIDDEILSILKVGVLELNKPKRGIFKALCKSKGISEEDFFNAWLYRVLKIFALASPVQKDDIIESFRFFGLAFPFLKLLINEKNLWWRNYTSPDELDNVEIELYNCLHEDQRTYIKSQGDLRR